MSFPHVLKLGGNNPALTRVLHYWFDLLEFPPPKDKANWQALGGKYTVETKDLVTRLQHKYGMSVHGEVRAAEWKQLGIVAGTKVWDPGTWQCITQRKRLPRAA